MALINPSPSNFRPASSAVAGDSSRSRKFLVIVGIIGGAIVVLGIGLVVVVSSLAKQLPTGGSTLTGGPTSSQVAASSPSQAKKSTCPTGGTAGRLVVDYAGDTMKVTVKNWIAVVGGTVVEQQDQRARLVVTVPVGQEKAAISGLTGRTGVVSVNCESAPGT